jgi:high frequency lysogenization protein
MNAIATISPELDRGAALAGIFQAAALVQRAARTNNAPDAALRANVASVLRLDAANTLDVYGGELSVLNLGFKTILSQLGFGDDKRDLELTKYISDLIVLERNLRKRPDLISRIQQGVHLASNQLQGREPKDWNSDPELLGQAVLGTLAQTYKETLSGLAPRIMVNGEPHLLNDTNNADRIRALLLSGIRSAVLWRQLGGSRRSLLLARQRIARVAQMAQQSTVS